MLVVLIWADDIGELIVLGAGVPLGAAAPEHGGVEDHLRTITDHERIIACYSPVLPDRVGNIRGDMDLDVARPDAHLLLTIGMASGGGHPARCDLVTGQGRFPGILGAFVAPLLRLAARATQRMIAIQ